MLPSYLAWSCKTALQPWSWPLLERTCMAAYFAGAADRSSLGHCALTVWDARTQGKGTLQAQAGRWACSVERCNAE